MSKVIEGCQLPVIEIAFRSNNEDSLWVHSINTFRTGLSDDAIKICVSDGNLVSNLNDCARQFVVGTEDFVTLVSYPSISGSN